MKLSLYATVGGNVTTRNDLAVMLELVAGELRRSVEAFDQLESEGGLTIDSGLLEDVSENTVGNWVIR